MTKRDYVYHFGYTAYPARIFKPIKAVMGSENLVNVMISSAALIGADLYLHPKLGPLFMSKFFFVSFFATYIFWAGFNPASGLNYRPLKPYIPKFDTYANDDSYYMGAD